MGKLEIEDWRLKIADWSGANRAAAHHSGTTIGAGGPNQSAIYNLQSSIINLPTGLEAVGGAVPLDSRFYVERPADAEFRAAVARRESIVLLKGAAQVGKSSLLARGLREAREAGARVVRTDFHLFNA